MTRDQLIEKVAAIMDEVNPLEQGETILTPQIDKQLDQAAVSLMEMLPVSIAMPVSPAQMPSSRNFVENFSIEVVCPPDFVRLHRLKLKDWIRSVTVLFPDGDRLFLLQDYEHVKSTFRRPAGSLRHEDGDDVITCYPPPEASSLNQDENDAVDEFVYVKKPSDATDVHDSLVDFLCWNCAAIVYAISGQGEEAELCRNRLAAMIETRVKHLK